MIEAGKESARDEILNRIDRTLLVREGEQRSGDEFFDEAEQQEREQATRWLGAHAVKIDQLILNKMKNWRWDPDNEYVHYLTMRQVLDGYKPLTFDEKKSKKDGPRTYYKKHIAEGYSNGTIQALQEFLGTRYENKIGLEKKYLREGKTQHEEWILVWAGLINR